MIKGVVFDMDGLMFDTERLGKEAWQRAAGSMGCQFSDELFMKILGTNAPATMKVLENGLGDKVDVRMLKKLHDDFAAERIEESGVPVKEGLKELLIFLKKNSYKITAASSTAQDKVRHYFEKAGVSDYFGEIVCGDMVTKCKPDPEIYLKALEKLALPPSCCLALEDSPYGILSAYSAGLKPVMIPDLVEPDEDTAKLLYAKLRSLSDVIGLLKEMK